MAKRIPGITPEWSNYLTCILLHLLLPLLPLLFEAMALQAAPTGGTLAITTAMYAMSIGPSSENKAMFGLCTIIGIVFSMMYGQVTNPKDQIPVSMYASSSMLLVFAIHACERYNRHVVDCRPFLEFASGRRA